MGYHLNHCTILRCLATRFASARGPAAPRCSNQLRFAMDSELLEDQLKRAVGDDAAEAIAMKRCGVAAEFWEVMDLADGCSDGRESTMFP
eukprot:Skav214013  [mRNA]  locus=scaffold1070:378285:379847:- [translate_table: standard]